MKKIIASIALTLCVGVAHAELDANADPLGANWVSGSFTGVYVIPGHEGLVRMAYDTITFRVMVGDGVPFRNLKIDSYDINRGTVNITYTYEGHPQMGTMQKYDDGVMITLGNGSQIPLQSIRVATKMDVKALFCATANTDTPPRGDRGFNCADMTASN
jgi:hypothetical protein